MTDSSKFSKQQVEQTLEALDEIPDELMQAYFDMLKSGVKARLSKDPNYASFKGKGRSENLDKLWGIAIFINSIQL